MIDDDQDDDRARFREKGGGYKRTPENNPGKGEDTRGTDENRRLLNIKDPVTVTEKEAFAVYGSLERSSLNETVRILRDQGHKISHTTVWRWSRDGDWVRRRDILRKHGGRLLEYDKASKALKHLSDEGAHFDIVSAVKGLQSRIVRLVADKILEEEPPPTALKGGTRAKGERFTERPDYYIQMAKLLSDLEDVKRKGYASDIQTKPNKEEPKVQEANIAQVHLGPFTRPANKK